MGKQPSALKDNETRALFTRTKLLDIVEKLNDKGTLLQMLTRTRAGLGQYLKSKKKN